MPQKKRKLVPVEFTSRWGGIYGTHDIAGFEPNKAKWLVEELKVAKYHKPPRKKKASQNLGKNNQKSKENPSDQGSGTREPSSGGILSRFSGKNQEESNADGNSSS